MTAAVTSLGLAWDVSPCTTSELAAALPGDMRAPRHVAYAAAQDDNLVDILTNRERVVVLYARDHLEGRRVWPHNEAYLLAQELQPHEAPIIDRAVMDRRLPRLAA